MAVLRMVGAALGTATLLAACGSGASPSETPADDAPAQANAAAAPASALCAPFPAGNIPPNPTPPYPTPPYGDPQQPSSLAALRSAVVQAAQDPAYSKNAVMCAEGADQPQVCNVDYWNIGGTPGREQDCNFFYLRVGNEYWSNGSNLGLTPLVLAQYGGYLGVIADGQDPANQNAGPHTTIAEYSGSWVYIGDRGAPAATFTPVNGKLDPANVAQALGEAVKLPITSSNRDAISPIIAGDRMTVDCSSAWLDTGSSWQPTNLAQLNPAAGTSFLCTGTGDGVGTAYIEAKLLADGSGGAPTPAAVSVRVVSDQSNTLRNDLNVGFTADNVVWPTGAQEVVNGTSIPFSISTGATCSSDGAPGNQQCLHLWVNFPNNPSLTVGPPELPALLDEPDAAAAEAGSDAAGDALGSGANTLACTIWFTLELDSPDLLATMSRYGLPTDGYTPHISLAKKKWQKSEIGAPTGTAAGKPDPCNDARLLANGQPGVDPYNPNP